ERRDAIARAYLAGVNPIVEPTLDGKTLTFRNAAVDAAAGTPPDGYRAAWFSFDNATGEARPLGETSARASSMPVPAAIGDGFIKVQLSATGGPLSWQRPVDAYFAREAEVWRLVG